jgi:CubicO group peptidase (beta-lactamase class C family)
MNCLKKSAGLCLGSLALVLLAASTQLHAAETALKPEAVQKILPELNAYVQDLQKRSNVPGIAIGIVVDGQTVLARGYGVRDIRSSDKVDAQTLFPLASVSKWIAGASVAALVGEKAIRWDDKISARAPGIGFFDAFAHQEMTFRDLLSQRSGLAAFYGDDLEMVFEYPREEIFQRLRYLPPATPFRTRYAYSNWNLTLAAELAARSTGQSWEQMVAQKIYQPLDMRSTVSSKAEFDRAPNRASAHRIEGGKAASTAFVARDQQSPGGGVASNVTDMLNWLAFQADGGRFQGRQIVAAEAFLETQTPQTLLSTRFPAAHYGLGAEVKNDRGRKLISHNGAFEEGINNLAFVLPDHKLGVVILTNGTPQGVPDAIADRVLALIFADRSAQDSWPALKLMWDKAIEASLGRSGRLNGKPPAAATAAQPLSAYVGTYKHPYFGDVVIEQQGNTLQMRTGKAKARALEHWSGDTFRLPSLSNASVTMLPSADNGARLYISELTDIANAIFVKD